MKEHEWLTITARLYGAQDLELESESAGCRSTHDEVDSDFMASDWIPFAMGPPPIRSTIVSAAPILRYQSPAPFFVALSKDIRLSYVPGTDDPTPDDPTPDDQSAADFGNEALLDIEHGPSALLETIVSYVPFMGWGWWEIVPGLRREGWRPPGNDPWRSRYDDGLLGIRRLAWLDCGIA